MADPVKGKDVTIDFRKNGDWHPYACATSVRIRFEMDTKSVKTIGDGNWEKDRGQKKRYLIELDGLHKFDDDTLPHAFDLYAYFDGMVPTEYRLMFVDSDGNLRAFEGFALPTALDFGGGSEGFANGSATLKGDGAPTLDTTINLCESEIDTAVQGLSSGNNSLQITAVINGPIERYDYSIDGGSRVSVFNPGGALPFTIVFGNGSGGVGTEHELTVWPICENGQDGESYTIDFENQPG